MHRSLIGGAVAALACLGFATPALADTTVPVTLSFNHVVLDTPSTPDAQIVSPSTAPLTVDAVVDTTNGTFTVQPSGYSEPTYNFTSPVPGSISVALKQPATGTIDFDTGAVTMNADLLATITITGAGSCVKDTGDLAFSTANKKPLPGQNFPAGATGALTGNGAIAAEWSSLAPGTGAGCALADSATQGSGGIWISRGISVDQATPHLTVATTAPKSVGSARTSTVKVKLGNSGASVSSPVKVCLAVPRGFKVSRCVTVSSAAMGASATVSFRVKAPKLTAAKGKKVKPKSYTLVATATSSGVTSASHRFKLTVK